MRAKTKSVLDREILLPALWESVKRLNPAAQLASLADETPEGRSIVVLAKRHGLRARSIHDFPDVVFIPFTAKPRMSGVNLGERRIRNHLGAELPPAVRDTAHCIAAAGGTPIVVAEEGRVLGVVYLKDLVKGGLADRFARLRAMGIKTIMITGDNPLTAASRRRGIWWP